jgi:hypothetical protein
LVQGSTDRAERWVVSGAGSASVKHICGNVIKQGRFGHNASHFPLKVAQGH